jgi:hypothetical protein
MSLPRDFRDEVETELQAACRALTAGSDRVAALEELRRVVVSLEASLARPVTVVDLIRSAPDAAERKRRTSLANLLRGRPH